MAEAEFISHGALHCLGFQKLVHFLIRHDDTVGHLPLAQLAERQLGANVLAVVFKIDTVAVQHVAKFAER